MNKTEFMVYWVNAEYKPSTCSACFDSMSGALKLMEVLRKNPENRFITMASESVDNVGKLGVDSVVDGKCADGGDFLGRISRHGIAVQRAKG
jgi:hypothetical protein